MRFRISSLFALLTATAIFVAIYVALNPRDPEIAMAKMRANKQGVDFLARIEIPQHCGPLTNVYSYQVGNILPASEARNHRTISLFTSEGWHVVHDGIEPRLPRYVENAFHGKISLVQIATRSEIRRALHVLYGPQPSSYDGPLDFYTDTIVQMDDCE